MMICRVWGGRTEAKIARTLFRLALGCALGVAACAVASADEPCPAKSQSYDDVVAAIVAAPRCAQALTVMNACLFVASGDVGLAQAVIDKCEPSFLSRLSIARRRAYSAAQIHCRNKYAGKQGTMYVSFAATCQARLAAEYAREYAAP
jgi:hypothetical protein